MPSTTETARKTTAERTDQRKKAAEKRPAEGKRGLSVHTLDAPIHIPYLTPADVRANARAATSWLPPLPPTRDLAFYGGLGALAVAGALDWPVALAVAGATAVVRGKRKEQQREQREE